MTTFSIATREELWSDGELLESRISHGRAVDRGHLIEADDRPDDELIALAAAEIERLRCDCELEGRVRIFASARRAGGTPRIESTRVLTRRGVSIVGGDPAVLDAGLSIRKSVDRSDLPILWLHGTAAVLLHEAVGHAAEHRAAPLAWPRWLSVRDEPPFAFDDEGEPARSANLLAEPPAMQRRESYRNVPLQRMSRVIVRADGAPFAVPKNRVEVHLVAGGAYDPLTDTVTVDIAASTAGAFRIRKSRAEIAASIAGASGDPIEYPGVICSREGQELIVGSFAPVILTR